MPNYLDSLKQARAQLASDLRELDRFIAGASGGKTGGKTAKAGTGKKRFVPAATRKNQSIAMKKVWAERRKKAGKSKS